MKNKKLIVLLSVLVVLGAGVLLFFLNDTQESRSTFNSKIVDVDSTQVTEVIIKTKTSPQFSIYKTEDESWKIKSDNKEFNADKALISNIITAISTIKAKRIAETSKDKWNDYEVSDSLATKVSLKSKSKVLADIFVGKYSFMQPTNPYQRRPSILSYIRLAGEKETYAIEGMLSLIFGRDAKDYRNQDICVTNKDLINKITYTYPDSSFTLLKTNGVWTLNGVNADSVQVDVFLSSIASMRNYSFAENVDAKTLVPVFKAIIEGPEPAIEIIASKSPTGYYIESSINKGTVFDLPKPGLVDQIFPGMTRFLPKMQ